MIFTSWKNISCIPDIGHSIIRDKVTPGYSEPGQNCGRIRYMDTCSVDPSHYQKPVKFHCKKPGCPICWTTWANREADSLVELIEGYESAIRSAYHARHISLSPPADLVKSFGYTWASPEALKWLYDSGNALIDKLGITAAAVIAHPYRIKDEWKRYINDEASKSGENRYSWALKQPDWYSMSTSLPTSTCSALVNSRTPIYSKSRPGGYITIMTSEDMMVPWVAGV